MARHAHAHRHGRDHVHGRPADAHHVLHRDDRRSGVRRGCAVRGAHQVCGVLVQSSACDPGSDAVLAQSRDLQEQEPVQVRAR